MCVYCVYCVYCVRLCLRLLVYSSVYCLFMTVVLLFFSYSYNTKHDSRFPSQFTILIHIPFLRGCHQTCFTAVSLDSAIRFQSATTRTGFEFFVFYRLLTLKHQRTCAGCLCLLSVLCVVEQYATSDGFCRLCPLSTVHCPVYRLSTAYSLTVAKCDRLPPTLHSRQGDNALQRKSSC